MRRVFVSYSRINLDAVTQLIEDLRAVGIETWYDQTLTGGQRWWDNILANIRECDIFVFALSPESWSSEACRSELGYVLRLGKSILPVLVSDGININLLTPPLNEIQVTDYRRRDKGATLDLFKSINAAPPAPPLPDPLPEAPPVPVSYLCSLKERIDSPNPLSSQEQITLLFELEEELREGRSPAEIRDLLLSLKRRDDLLAKIATKVDAALKSLEDKTHARPVENVAPQPAGPAYAHPAFGGGGPQPGGVGVRFCPQCRTQAGAGSRFCGACGAPLGQPGGAFALAPGAGMPPGECAPKVEGSKCRRYVCAADVAPRLIADLKGWLDSQGFDSQQLNAEGQSLLLQVKKRGGWRDLVGMSTSLNILFHQSGDTLSVEIGAGKWIDKAAAGTVSLLILWPLAITAGIGAWEQMKLPDRIFDFIGSRLVYK
ncbi:MAG TPA: TIR domain-containing protein [Pyrinomonadaceae bacterium]|nr:TIR domain-containing protein [Pyrinomonadaceae bacterium]